VARRGFGGGRIPRGEPTTQMQYVLCPPVMARVLRIFSPKLSLMFSSRHPAVPQQAWFNYLFRDPVEPERRRGSKGIHFTPYLPRPRWPPVPRPTLGFAHIITRKAHSKGRQESSIHESGSNVQIPVPGLFGPVQARGGCAPYPCLHRSPVGRNLPG